MRRRPIAARPDWPAKVEALGLVWHTPGGVPYWNEHACYSFTGAEVAAFEAAVVELHRLFIEAGDHVLRHGLLDRFGVPEWCWPLIAEAWRDEPPALNYGRFDLGYDGAGPPKLFEFNCDTPTALLEAAVVQWQWKEEVFPALDQYNSLHERLIQQWRDMTPLLRSRTVHFAHGHDRSGEDAVTTAYLMDTAAAAGLTTQRLWMSDIGWGGGRFYDLQEREIRTLYHLYPWEWIVAEPFGRKLLENGGRTAWVEPIWKMIWSNKAILPLLWALFPGHPNLLWASFDPPRSGGYVEKPVLAREGANVRIVRAGREIAATPGPYGDSPTLFQDLFDLPCLDGAYPVLGCWIVDGGPAGMGVREDGLITGNLARFVPHVIEG